MMARPRVRHGAWNSTFHALASVSTFCSEAVPLQVGGVHTRSQQSAVIGRGRRAQPAVTVRCAARNISRWQSCSERHELWLFPSIAWPVAKSRRCTPPVHTLRTARHPPEGQHRGALRCAPPQHSVRIACWVPHSFPPAESSQYQYQHRMQRSERHVATCVGMECMLRESRSACMLAPVPCGSTATGTTPADRRACFAQAGPLTAPGQTAPARSSRRHTRCPVHPPPGRPAVTSRAGGWLRGRGDVNR